MTREEAKHIDAFKYWCETNEENGVITIPKFLCDHIVEILDDTNARPHGDCRDRLKEVFREYSSISGDMFHLSQIENIIDGEDWL